MNKTLSRTGIQLDSKDNVQYTTPENEELTRCPESHTVSFFISKL